MIQKSVTSGHLSSILKEIYNYCVPSYMFKNTDSTFPPQANFWWYILDQIYFL